jgi:hypothetical protein
MTEQERATATDALVDGAAPDLFWGDVLQSFPIGLQMDLRARLALEFLKAGAFVNLGPNIGATVRPGDESRSSTLEAAIENPARQLVGFALDVAAELVDQGFARGLMKALPETGNINAATKKHIERNVRAQLYQQEIAQKIQAETASRIGVVPPGTVLGNGRG